MFRSILLVGALALTGCVQTKVIPVESEPMVIPPGKPIMVNITHDVNYDKLCADIFLRNDDRAKVELESNGVQWDTLDCRRAALEEKKVNE